MKNIIFTTLLLFVFLSSAQAITCAAKVVTWPEDVNKACRSQIQMDAQTGSNVELVDSNNSNSKAKFFCNPYEWIYVSGSCSVSHNFDCIAAEMQTFADTYDVPQFHRMTAKRINEALNSVSFPGRRLVVDSTNRCDKLSY